MLHWLINTYTLQSSPVCTANNYFLGLVWSSTLLSITHRMQLLRTWKGKYGPHATYKNLAIAFFNARKPELIEEICRVLGFPIEISEQDLESTPPPPQQKGLSPDYIHCSVLIAVWGRVGREDYKL